MVKRNLILSGGVAHDYPRTSAMLAEILEQADIRSEICEDFQRIGEGLLADFDLVTLNCARWTCRQPQISPAWRQQAGFEVSAEVQRSFAQFLAAGKGLLALHAATLCFNDWPAYSHILGAWWEWGYSGHAPLQEHLIQVRTDAHPVVMGIGDFAIHDELYTHPRIADTLTPLATGEWAGEHHPVLWVRDYGTARICYCGLGHGVEAFANPSYRLLLQRGARWVLRELEERSP